MDKIGTSDDTGPICQVGTGVRDVGSVSMEVKTRHYEARKVSCNLVRPDFCELSPLGTRTMVCISNFLSYNSLKKDTFTSSYAANAKLFLNRRTCIHL